MSAQGITKQPNDGGNLWLGPVCQPLACPGRAPFNGSGSTCCRGTLEKVFDLLPECWEVFFFFYLSALKHGEETVVEPLIESPSADMTQLEKGA